MGGMVTLSVKRLTLPFTVSSIHTQNTSQVPLLIPVLKGTAPHGAHNRQSLGSKRKDESETVPPDSQHEAARGWRPGFRSSLWVVERCCPRP